MTNEEAIKIAKSTNALMNGCNCVGKGEYVEAIIEALEKQIPKKPMLEADGYYNGELVYDTWVCPSCGTRYETDYDEHLYCPHCGQAISFEEVEE